MSANPVPFPERPLEDRLLHCRECRQPFIFTIGEQKFFREKDFRNDPARCPQCRERRKTRFSGGERRRG
jgi:hypothetical protein